MSEISDLRRPGRPAAAQAPGAGPVTDTAPEAPAAKPARHLGLDVARALAVLGMLLAHFGGTLTEDDGWQGSVVRFTDGRAMPLFVILSGVGVALLVQRSTQPWRVMVGRAVLLLLVGLAFEFTTPVAVILQYYALFFLVAVALRRLPTRWLLPAAALVVALGVVNRWYVAPHLPTPYQVVPGDPSVWGGLGLLLRPHVLVSTLVSTGTYPLFPAFAFVLVGLWLGRQDLASARVRRGLVVVGLAMAVVGYGAGWATDHRRTPPAELSALGDVGSLVEEGDRYGVTLRDLIAWGALSDGQRPAELFEDIAAAEGVSVDELDAYLQEVEDSPAVRELRRPSWWDVLDARGHSQRPAWMVGATGAALAVIGLCLMASRALPRVTRPLAMAGQLALTLYVTHLALLRWPLDDWPWTWSPTAVVTATVTGFVVAVALATVWRLVFAHGPLEWALRAAGGRWPRRARHDHHPPAAELTRPGAAS